MLKKSASGVLSRSASTCVRSGVSIFLPQTSEGRAFGVVDGGTSGTVFFSSRPDGCQPGQAEGRER